MKMGEIWASAGSVMASAMFIYAIFQQYFPSELRSYINKYVQKVVAIFYPYIQITFQEFSGDGFERSNAYSSIERYLAANSSNKAKRLKATMVRDSKSIVLSMDDYEEIMDEYQGVKLWWGSNKFTPNRQSISFYPREDDKRYYKLTFHRQHRDLVTTTYLSHVLEEGKEIAVKSRQRKLYTNNKSGSSYGYRSRMWSSVIFEHPATFDTWALEPSKKEEIIKDLIRFSKAKDYYKKVGKAWKRGYLLYGPPGTGKSTMIAAMANLLEYDIYDLELTSVKDNTELRKLLIDTSSKSIIVIEDIDCSLNLTGQRKKDEKKDDDKEDADVKKAKKELEGGKEDNSKVTLSGLLNFIDGLWSACGGERIIVFTTNYVEKLDPALIRRGRMDKHIELSYCGFEAFKVLARNYLDVDDHEVFEEIRKLLGEVNMTPADVAENLMPKCDEDDAETCLKSLIMALETAKEEAKMKAEEEEKERLKAEEEEKAKKEEEENAKEKKEDDTASKEVKENGVLAKEVKENGIVDKEVKENGVVSKE